MREALNSKVVKLNNMQARTVKEAQFKAKLTKEITEGNEEMHELINAEYFRQKIAEANRFVNAKENHKTMAISSSDDTTDLASGPFDESQLVVPIPVDLKQI